MASPKILHIAGWGTCGFYRRVSGVLTSLSLLFPNRLKIVEHDFVDRTRYREWLVDGGFRKHFIESPAHDHVACPLIWSSKSINEGDPDPADIESYIGGHDAALDWCRDFMTPNDHPLQSIGMMEDGHESGHEYEYDLVVIGGGSGGMAAAKEAAALGAKVACLDFVKPSPKGTTWGLGGTCVNVGCIPKKLFHIGASLRESIQADSETFGIPVLARDPPAEGEAMAWPPPPLKAPEIEWETISMNVQNYIRSLNFKYRVRLREKNVNYLNKLAKFTDKHTIEAVDKKGKTSTITSSRFLIATGGRPAPLDCPGAELAISSDDIFFLGKNPGKTLCVGASYISLECAGFLAGFGIDVTVAVRSILLRGFDRECSERIGSHMKEHGVKFKNEVVPKSLEKVDGDRIKVTFSDGSDDVFDTVLGAVGRHADTDKLGLETVGVKTNAKNGKILTTHEQSSCPNIYAVGDVMEGCPELTPVAIQAGLVLARRLFGGSKEPMDYVNICTTVFTPLEYSCVGLSEEDAIAKHGDDNIEVYHREFIPLQWSASPDRTHANSFAKVIVNKLAEEKVLGIHYVGPDAGEVMQGYGVAMKQGLTFKTLTDTVGIHPTSSEEIVTLSVTKSSGEDAAAGGC